MKPIQILVAVDQLANTLLGGWADETLSAKAHRCRSRAGWDIARRVINGIFFWQTNHCLASFNAELERRQLPVEYR